MNANKSSWLDRPLLDGMTLDREKAFYGLLIALAVVSRLWSLGPRVMSHDETIHAQWSWYLYQGQGYQHTPLSHGPFLYHATALVYYLFGDNDVTARLVPALMGVVLVALPYAMRRWLGRSGALAASFLLLISPSLLYYSRYARHDVPIVVWSLIAAWAILRYLKASEQTRDRTRWLIVLAAALSLMFATKEVSFIYVAIFGLFLVLLFIARLGAPRRGTPVWESWRGISFTGLGLIAVMALAVGLSLFSLNMVELFPIRYGDCGQAPVPGAVPGQMTCTQAGCELIQGRCQRPLPVVAHAHAAEVDETGARVAVRLTWVEVLMVAVLMGAITILTGVGVYQVLDRWMPFKRGERPALDLTLFVGSFTLPFLSPLAINGLSRVASRLFFGIDAAFNALDYSEAGLLRSTGFVFILVAVSITVGLWWDRRRWLPAAAVFYAIFVVLFTTVFTNGNGLASGVVGSLGYWVEQQAVERGSQPFYYYGLIVPLYEYLPLIGFIAAALYTLTRHPKPKRADHPPPSTVSLAPARSAGDRLPSTFVIFWAALTWPTYTIAGEKMPWLTVHFAAPMALASGWIIGALIESVDWRAIWRRGGWLVVLVAPLGWAALVQTVSPWFKTGALRPFSGHSVSQLNATNQFIAALFALVIALAALRWAWRRIGHAAVGRILAGLGLALLAALTVRTSWAASFINGDYASEFLVFAHGNPDVREIVKQIEEISRRTGGDHSLDVGYTREDNYPYIWYLRDYPNAVQLSSSPGRQDLKSVIIVADKVWSGFQPYVEDAYACNHYDRLWWPMEDYRNLNLERVRYALANPEMRAAVGDIVFRRDFRRYEQVTGKTVRLSQWPLRDGVRLCVRRDVLARMWDETAEVVDLAYDGGEAHAGAVDYSDLEQHAVAELEIAALGGPWGNLSGPHGLAMDADGYLYVADTDNHRIVKFSSAGEVVDTWDSTWWRDRSSWKPNGCLDEADLPLARGDGEFCEPWGVAVGPDGRVYVADTWNHRIQVFTADGQFVARVGSFGQSGGAVSSAPAQFYGPRDVAVARDGRVYVSDTGNKRVQVFDADLNHLYSFGGPGIAEGWLDEPVGIAVGPDDWLYVADTWNRRVQVFTPGGDLVRVWTVAGWEGQSGFNKPYIAVDSAGHVYVSDPEAARFVVFDTAGNPLTAIRGGEDSYLQLPTGVLLDAEDRLWISDAANHRLLRFPPVDLEPE